MTNSKNASNEKTLGVGYGYGGFRSFVGMGILWEFPQVCCGYGMKKGTGSR